MVEQYRFLNLVERLPKLSSEEESQLIKLCYQGRLEPLDPEGRTLFPFMGLPNIEVLGMPNAGKTTSLKVATQTLKELGIQVEMLKEPDVPFDKDDSPILHALTMFHRAADALFAHQFNREASRPLLLDGGIYKQIAFLKTFEVLHEVNSEDAAIATRYIERFLGGYVDGLIICHASPELSLAREEPREELGRIMNPKFLAVLSRTFSSLSNRIVELRQETLLRNSPLLIAELNSDQEWETYLNIFIRTIGTMCHRFASGGINI